MSFFLSALVPLSSNASFNSHTFEGGAEGMGSNPHLGGIAFVFWNRSEQFSKNVREEQLKFAQGHGYQS